MGAVLGSVPLNDLVFAVIPLNGEGHLNDMVAMFHVSEDTPNFGFSLFQGQFGALDLGQVFYELVFYQDAGLVEKVLDHVEETGVGVFRHILQRKKND